MEFIFEMVGAVTVVLIILFIGITIWHYFFYVLIYIFKGKAKILEYLLTINTGGLNLLLYFYILMLLPLLFSTSMGLLDSFKIINLNELLNSIGVETKGIQYSFYRSVALFISFLLVLFNLLFIVKGKYTLFIKQVLVKIIK